MYRYYITVEGETKESRKKSSQVCCFRHTLEYCNAPSTASDSQKQ